MRFIRKCMGGGRGVPLTYNPDCQQLRLSTTFCLQLRLPTFPIANRAIVYKQLLRIFKNWNINVHIAHMTLLRTDTLHTWHYCAHDIIAYMKKKIVFSLCTQNIIVHKHIAHMTLLDTYTLHTCLYCAHTHCTHDFIAHIHIAHMTLLRTYTLHI